MFVDDIIYVLGQESVGVAGSTLFVGPGAVVPKGTTAVVIYETGGAGPTLTQNITESPSYTNPSAQIVAHGPTYVAAAGKAQAAYDALYKVRNEYIGSGEVLPWYLWIRPTQEPFPLGVDPQGNIRVAFNVNARRRK